MRTPSKSTLRLALVATLSIGTLASAPAALANMSNSSNWAGYAVHRQGMHFTRVIGAWTEPSATCTPGHRTYSAFWVGLGGYSTRSRALEQIGTEVDCLASGRVRSSAWYEAVPASSRTIKLPVSPGDTVSASVQVDGHRVTLALYDVTTKRWFRKTLHRKLIDTSAAEWIAEAPSECLGNACRTLPLANFGQATFSSATATEAGGHAGTISDPDWGTTRIRLTPGGRRVYASQHTGAPAAVATPSALTNNGSEFTVSYSQVILRAGQAERASQAAVLDGRIVHPLLRAS